jgi:hypothetical protein
VTAADLDRFMRDGWTKHFGYGPWFRVDDDGPLVCLKKEGINPGASGPVRHYPRRDLTVVMFWNLEKGVWDPIGVAHEMVVEGAFD